MRFKVVPASSRMLGGHYAVEDNWGRVIGVRWGLDKVCAEELRHELQMAHDLAKEERHATQERD